MAELPPLPDREFEALCYGAAEATFTDWAAGWLTLREGWTRSGDRERADMALQAGLHFTELARRARTRQAALLRP